MALVVFNEDNVLLGQFHTQERMFNFTGLEQSIVIHQDWNRYGVAAVVWEAAIVLANYLISISAVFNKDTKVLELGSGTGLTGIVAAMLNANVTLTDQANALEPLHKNTERNLNSSKHTFQVKDLLWGKDLQSNWQNAHFDYIIGTDLVYIESTFHDLVSTFAYFAIINPKVTIFLSGKTRYQERYNNFLEMLKTKFQVSYVSNDEETQVYVLKIIKRD